MALPNDGAVRCVLHCYCAVKLAISISINVLMGKTPLSVYFVAMRVMTRLHVWRRSN